MQVDQAHLETVLPSPGGKVLILKGAYTGQAGTLKSIDQDKFQAEVETKDKKLHWIEYEDVSKYSPPWQDTFLWHKLLGLVVRIGKSILLIDFRDNFFIYLKVSVRTLKAGW